MSIRPITIERDLKAALKRIDELIEIDNPTYLDELVLDYGSTHCPMPPPEPIAAIEFVMEQRGLNRRDLHEVGCSCGRVSEFLNSGLTLTVNHIRTLHQVWRIPWSCLLGEDLEQTGS